MHCPAQRLTTFYFPFFPNCPGRHVSNFLCTVNRVYMFLLFSSYVVCPLRSKRLVEAGAGGEASAELLSFIGIMKSSKECSDLDSKRKCCIVLVLESGNLKSVQVLPEMQSPQWPQVSMMAQLNIGWSGCV